LTEQNTKTAFSREALTAGTSAHTTFGETPKAQNAVAPHVAVVKRASAYCQK